MRKSLSRLILAVAGVGSAYFASPLHAALTWSVQADFTSTTTRSVRGIGLSPDGSQEYLGFIQGASGTTAVDEYATGSTFTGGNPAGTGATNTVTLNGEQPKGVAVDDRGYVYATYSFSGMPTTVSQNFRIYSSDLSTLEGGASVGVTLPAKSQLGGIAVQDAGGGTYYAYVSSNKGSGVIERYNVSDPTHAVLDTSWASSGVLNLQSILSNANIGLNGLDVASDGTIYATGAATNGPRGDTVFKIINDGSPITSASITTASVTQAFDVTQYGGNLYVAEYNADSSQIAVLSASDLSAPQGIITTPFVDSVNVGNTDHGYAGITVDSAGHLYVTDEDYNGVTATSPDRVLVSSALPEPATMSLLALGGALVARRRRTC